jgi:hypothetical protein
MLAVNVTAGGTGQRLTEEEGTFGIGRAAGDEQRPCKVTIFMRLRRLRFISFGSTIRPQALVGDGHSHGLFNGASSSIRFSIMAASRSPIGKIIAPPIFMCVKCSTLSLRSTSSRLTFRIEERRAPVSSMTRCRSRRIGESKSVSFHQASISSIST